MKGQREVHTTMSPMMGEETGNKDRMEAVQATIRKWMVYMAERRLAINWTVFEGDEEDSATLPEIGLDDLQSAPAKMEDVKADVQDPLMEVNLGTQEEHRITYISQVLEPGMREQIFQLLKQYRDCFAWDYHEMPGLDRKLVEHKLPIKQGFKPKKQPPRRMAPEACRTR